MADISGTWLGTYWQASEPTRFEATLIQSGNDLSGRILDDGMLGEAQINGEVVGRSIGFVKRYLTTSVVPVRYEGTISEDESFMQGSWTIAGSASGNWEAHRGGDNLMAELKNTVQKTVSLVGSR